MRHQLSYSEEYAKEVHRLNKDRKRPPKLVTLKCDTCKKRVPRDLIDKTKTRYRCVDCAKNRTIDAYRNRIIPWHSQAITLRAKGKTLREIGMEIGVSFERVRQVLKKHQVA